MWSNLASDAYGCADVSPQLVLDLKGRLVAIVVSKLADPGIESLGLALQVSHAVGFVAGDHT